MGRPARPLAEHIRQATFRARRHHPLLAGADLPWSGFARLQARYRAATSEPERRAVAVECERAARHARSHAGTGGRPSLDQELRKLGKPGSVQQLLGFFPRFLRHSKGPLHGQPFQLEPWQKGFLRELYRRDRSGRRLYKRAILGLPQGNGKTALTAGLGLYELLRNVDNPEIYLAAATKQQAQIGLDLARAMAEHDPLNEWISTGSSLSCPSRGGTMQALSSQGALHQGRAPSAALIENLGSYTTTKHNDTYTALTSGLHKRPDSYLLATATAGADRNGLLGRIYHDTLNYGEVTTSRNGCLTTAKNPATRTLLWWYAAPDHADPENPKIIRGCNPASWISIQDLQHHLHGPTLTESDFRRHHLNQWPPTDKPRQTNPRENSAPQPTPVQPEQMAELFREINRRYQQTAS